LLYFVQVFNQTIAYRDKEVVGGNALCVSIAPLQEMCRWRRHVVL
jgi:hypothetical protein